MELVRKEDTLVIVARAVGWQRIEFWGASTLNLNLKPLGKASGFGSLGSLGFWGVLRVFSFFCFRALRVLSFFFFYIRVVSSFRIFRLLAFGVHEWVLG